MRTPVRFLALMTGCGLGAGVFAAMRGHTMLGLKLLAVLVILAVVIVVVRALARERAYNRRAADRFRAVLADDAAHHAAHAADTADSRQVSR